MNSYECRGGGRKAANQGMLALRIDIRHVLENWEGFIGLDGETHLLWLVSNVDLIQPDYSAEKTLNFMKE